MKKPIDELADILHRSTDLFAEAVMGMIQARISGRTSDEEAAVKEIDGLLANSMGLADLMGRKRAWMEFDRVIAKERCQLAPDFTLFDAGETTPVIPHVRFDEAIDKLLSLEPRLARSSAEVRELYAKGGSFSLFPGKGQQVRQTVIERIQAQISAALKEGQPIPQATERIRELGNFSRSYACTVYRTNIATAYAYGREKIAQEEEVRNFLPAFEFNAVGDADTRPNHKAAHGLLADANDPVWERFTPPAGYSCRCLKRLVSIFELRRRGLLRKDGSVISYYPPTFSQAHPDPGFGRRPR